MDEPKLSLAVDGVDFAAEFDDIEVSTPRAVHVIPMGEGARCLVPGPASFTVVVVSPSDRLYGLVDDGKAVREVKVAASGLSITHPTRFHKGWVDADGVRKMFGSLAPDREREAKWVEEQPVGASVDRAEGN